MDDIRIQKRIGHLAAKLAENRMDLAIILQNVDLYYYTGTLSQGLLLVDAEGRHRFCVQKPVSRAREESPLPVIPVSGMREWGPQIKDFLGNRSCRTVGMETDVVPWDVVQFVREILPDAQVRGISGIIRAQRAMKDDGEQRCIEAAGAILSSTYEALRGFLRPGLTELEVAAFIESHMRKAGHQGILRVRKWNMELYYGAMGISSSVRRPTLFDGPVGSLGLYPAAPYFSGKAILQSPDTLMVDLMAGVDGYLADATRTFAIGDIPRETLRVHEVLMQIEEDARKRLVPGENGENLYRNALEQARAAGIEEGFMGFSENRVRFLGHGVGLEIDEFPVLAMRFTEPFATGMAVAVEPKHFAEFCTGVENTFIVTPDGGRRVVDFPSDIVFIG